MSKLAQRLKELREERKLSQSKVAEDNKTNQSTYAQYESGRREPSIDIVCRFADYYKVTTDYLLGLSDIAAHDMDADAINKVTGLSLKSIELLRYDKKRANLNDRIPQQYVEATNALIEQELYKLLAKYLFVEIPAESFVSMQLRDGTVSANELEKSRLLDPRSKDQFINPNEYAPVFESLDIDGRFLLRAYMDEITEGISEIRNEIWGMEDAKKEE